MRVFIMLCIGGIIAWLIVSQIIAYIITPSPKQDDDVVDMWFYVFIAPVLFAMLILSWIDNQNNRMAYYFGLTKNKPKDDFNF